MKLSLMAVLFEAEMSFHAQNRLGSNNPESRIGLTEREKSFVSSGLVKYLNRWFREVGMKRPEIVNQPNFPGNRGVWLLVRFPKSSESGSEKAIAILRPIGNGDWKVATLLSDKMRDPKTGIPTKDNGQPVQAASWKELNRLYGPEALAWLQANPPQL